jgi:hypothetical protein
MNQNQQQQANQDPHLAPVEQTHQSAHHCSTENDLIALMRVNAAMSRDTELSSLLGSFQNKIPKFWERMIDPLGFDAFPFLTT